VTHADTGDGITFAPWRPLNAETQRAKSRLNGSQGECADRVVKVFTNACMIAFGIPPVRKVLIGDSYAAWSAFYRAVMGEPEPLGPAMFLAVMEEWRGYPIKRADKVSYHDGGSLRVPHLCDIISGTTPTGEFRDKFRAALHDAEKCGILNRPLTAQER